MSILEEFYRVTKNQKCPVCGKPDWCLIGKDGKRVICPKVPEGATSVWGDAGYLHFLSNEIKAPRVIYYKPKNDDIPVASVNAEALAMKFGNNLPVERVKLLATSLGVSWQSLGMLDIGWSEDHQSYTFPMRDHDGKVIGIRTRAIDGSKKTVYGTRNGLFMVMNGREQGPLIVVEGPTDAAAAHDLGYRVIGRPSCNGGKDMLHRLCLKTRPEIVIVSDNDGPGLNGAYSLADHLHGVTKWVKVVRPLKGKDLRKWLNEGLRPAVLNAVIQNVPCWARRSAAHA